MLDARSGSAVRPIHQYADWDKLSSHGWPERFGVPTEFQNQSDDEIWWPRNNRDQMRRICADAGWDVITMDMGFFERDSVVLLERRR